MSLTQEALRDLLASLNGGDPERARDLLTRFLPDFVDVYGQTAAVLGADFYDAIRNLPPSAGTASVVLAQPAKQKQAEGVVRWALGRLFVDEPDWASFESALLGSTQRLVLQPARETVDLMAAADAKSRKVAAVGWSREIHPERARSGKSCNFCKMLAGRGPVYRSDESAGMLVGRGVDSSIALDENGKRRVGYVGGVGGGVKARGSRSIGNDYHDNCHCVPVPTFYTRESRPITTRGYTRNETVLVPISQ
ncbi:hypothetical protein [Microbacterium testaceum]|uniref:VG15 protein n=1 Tax=Microbacterium testaceum TaxID=2033 RepID=UPI000A8DC734|nr:hypothetical protein [Microbacterium testaceum]